MFLESLTRHRHYTIHITILSLRPDISISILYIWLNMKLHLNNHLNTLSTTYLIFTCSYIYKHMYKWRNRINKWTERINEWTVVSLRPQLFLSEGSIVYSIQTLLEQQARSVITIAMMTRNVNEMHIEANSKVHLCSPTSHVVCCCLFPMSSRLRHQTGQISTHESRFEPQ